MLLLCGQNYVKVIVIVLARTVDATKVMIVFSLVGWVLSEAA